MGWNSQLQDISGCVIEVATPHQMFGSTITMDCGTGEPSTRRLELDFTSNYGRHFKRVFGEEGMWSIRGLTGADAAPVLEFAARRLKDNTHPDHWKPTQGNAKQILLKMAAMSRMRPDGVWWLHN